MTSPRTPFLLLVCLGAALGAAESAFAQIPVARADVDRNCTVTTADANIVKAQLGKRTGQAGFNPNADVDQNGVVNNVDATFVARNIGKNVCAPPPPPPAAPTIVASIAPPANAFGWHNAAATVSFTCTNAVSCPAPVTVSTEGAAQVVARTVANSAGATASASVTLNLDLTPPVVTAVAPAVVAPGTAVAIPVTATDLSGVAASSLLLRRAVVATRTSAPWDLAWTVTAAFAPGAQDVFEVIVEDRAGNAAAVRRTFSVQRPDTTNPTVSIGAPATAGPGAIVPLTVRAADDSGDPGRVRVTRNDPGGATTIDDRTAGPFSFQITGQIPAGATAGTIVSFVATVTDASGNTAAASTDVQVVTSVTTQTLDITVDPPVSPTFQTDGVITGRIGRGTAIVPPPATPLVASLSPTSGGQGQTVDITITGVNTAFGPLTQVALGTGVTVQSVSVTSPTTIVARALIASNASVGPRLVAVSTGREEALLPSGFAVVSGLGTVSGRVVSAATQPIANAQICQPSSVLCTASNAAGTFTFAGLPVDVRRVVVTASGFEPLSLPVALTPNGASAVGDVILTAASQPPPPPLPNSPPISPALAVVLGRGANDIGTSVNPDQLRALVRDTIIAVGGREIGVLDTNGQQLNSRMVGAGYASFTEEAIEDIAQEVAFGSTRTLAQLLTTLANSITLPGVTPPTLGQLITGFQARVNAAWQDPTSPGAPLLMVLFNKGRVVSAAPPTLTFDMEMNALQTNLMAVSFMTFVRRYLPEGAPLPYSASAAPAVEPRRLGLLRRAGDVLAALLPRPAGGAALSSSYAAGVRGGSLAPLFGRLRAPLQQSVIPGYPDADRPGSIIWRGTYESVLGQTGWDTAKKFGKVCDGFLVSVATGTGEAVYQGGTPQATQAAKDPYAKILPQPDCKTVIDLLSILAQSGEKSYANAAKTLKGYYAGIAATRDMGKVIDTYYSSQSQKDAFAAVKAEARQLQIQTSVINLGAGLVSGALTKLQGAVVDSIVQFESQLLIESVRPRQPFITKVEQLSDPTFDPPTLSHYVKVSFSPSPNDKGAGNDQAVSWRYRLYRGKGGLYSPVSMKVFKPGDEYFFADLVPGDGTYSYVVVGVRQIGAAIDEPPPTNAFIGFLGGFFDTTLKIGAEGAKRAVIGLGILTNFTTPALQIVKGIRYQTSDPSAPALLYVSTAPPTPKPPASLGVWGATGITYVSVPAINRIFAVSNGRANLIAVPNFKAPGAVGLGVSGNGSFYTDNSASDAQFGGRVFGFSPANGARSLAGTVNYFSQLLMFANPVSVQAMTVASGPFGSNLNIHEETLFIADAQNQRITRMVLPTNLPANYPFERNVSQPWVSSPLFNFGPDTAMAMSGSYRMAITQADNILFATPAGAFAPPTGVQQLFSSTAPSPYQRLSGVTFDGRTNLYVSDSVQGTLTMIPAERSAPNNGLLGLSPIDRKKLVITRGLLRPSDVKLSSSRDGLVFYDAERILAEVRFGMSGQVVSDTGSPLAGAIVHVPALRRVETTDSDGVFVMPDLVQIGTSPVVDFTVQHQGQTRSYSRVLDVFSHNIVDVTFNGTPPPIPPDPSTPPTVNPPPAPVTRAKTDPSVTVSVEFELDPTAPPPPPALVATSCPRGVILSPGFGASTTSATVTVNGLVSNRWAFGPSTVPGGFLIVNGVPTPVTLSGLEFSTTAALVKGDNTLAFALPAAVLKPLGCAPPTALDTDPISISGDHRVFHDPLQAEVDAYRAASGWDIAARAIVRTGGVPLAGLDFVVPGTGVTATTDADGVAQINLSKSKMAAGAAAADQLASGLFNAVGRAVASLRADQLAPSLATLESILAATVGAANSPTASASNARTLASNLTRLQGIVTGLIETLRALQSPSPADISALESVGLQFASTTSNGEIVITARDYPGLTLTVKVQ